MSASSATTTRSHLPIRPDWLALGREAVLDPGLPIVDPHHHLWDHPGNRYLVPQFLEDAASGHNIVGTIFIECGSMYRENGQPLMRSVGETEFVSRSAAIADSGGACRVAAGIVAHVDLLAGDKVAQILPDHFAAADGRLRGIRNISAWHADPAARGSLADPPEGLLMDASFRRGFSHLSRHGLVFDAWMYHTQLHELYALASAFPDTRIVVNHVGGPIGIGPYAGCRDAVFNDWRTSIRALAACPNVSLKVGGFGMRLFGFDFHEGATPPSSAQMASAWRPYVETSIEVFGTRRCMFESNFPVDKAMGGYAAVWNAFKHLAADYSEDERADVFSRTAAQVYSLSELLHEDRSTA
jgi:L-fuconolactonase